MYISGVGRNTAMYTNNSNKQLKKLHFYSMFRLGDKTPIFSPDLHDVLFSKMKISNIHVSKHDKNVNG